MAWNLTRGWDEFANKSAVAGFVDTNLKGAGQVMFQANALTGLLFLVGIGYGAVVAGTPAVAIGAAVGLVVSTVTGMCLQPDRDTLRSGLYGYNGILVGAAIPTFLGGTAWMWAYLVVGAMASTVVFMATANVFKTWGVAALTFPFNLVNWTFLLAAFQFARLNTTPLGRSYLPEQVTDAQAHVDLTGGFVFDAVFKNLAQVFLINNSVTGVIFVVALLASSAAAAAFALLGSVVALIAAVALGASATSIQNGLFGFSAVLTALALGVVFYAPSVRVLLYSIFGVLVTVVLTAMLMTGLAVWSLPAGTAPFVFATWLFLLPRRNFQPVAHELAEHGSVAEAPKN